jgi:adenylate kinase family enzyme
VPWLTAVDALPGRPHRVLVAGTSGSGKTTLGQQIGARAGVPHTEIDGLFHGPGWTPRPEFLDDVAQLMACPEWVTEWQYDAARPILLGRADLLVWLDLPRSTVIRRVTVRTVRRRIGRHQLWNGNVEQPLWRILTDREHIIRWAWKTHGAQAGRVRAASAQRPDLTVVRLRSARQVEGWLEGPLCQAVANAGD